MFNEEELQGRNFPYMMEGGQFLTTRTSTEMVGDSQYYYMGYAHPGSAEGDPVWMIQRVIIAANESTATLFGGGQALFNQIWANRVTLAYS